MEALTREQARRIAVRAQLVDARRPESVLDVIQRLGFLQYDLTRAVAPSQDVILWSRLGEEYDLGTESRRLGHVECCVRPGHPRSAAQRRAAPDHPAARHVRGALAIRLAALGIARAKTVQTPVEPNDVGPVGIQATVEGVRGTWQVDPTQLDRLDEAFEGRAALLSPEDEPWTPAERAAVVDELESLARWLDLALVLP